MRRRADVPVDFRGQFSSSTHTLATATDGKGLVAELVIDGRVVGRLSSVAGEHAVLCTASALGPHADHVANAQ